MPGAAPLHDVEGGVVEGDEGEAAGEAVLHELLGGGGAGPRVGAGGRRVRALGGRGRAQAGHRHRAEEGEGERLLGRGLRLGLVRRLGDQLGEGGAQELGQVLGRLGLGHSLAQDTVGAGLGLGALGRGVRDDVLHGLLHRGHVAEAAVAPVVVAGLGVRVVRGLGVEFETNTCEICISCIMTEKAPTKRLILLSHAFTCLLCDYTISNFATVRVKLYL